MSQIQEVFNRPKVVLPVIHVKNASQGAQMAHVAFKAGADGVWLINHKIPAWGLVEVYRHVRAQLGDDAWIGLNILDKNVSWHVGARTLQGRASGHTWDGVWADDPQALDGQTTLPDLLSRHHGKDRFLFFGGVAFKGQEILTDDEAAERAMRASPYMVVTTSGPATGSAPTVSKVARIREVIPDKALALASGVTLQNVSSFLPYVDAFLVATGISKDFYTLDPHMTQDLVDRVHAYTPAQ